MIKLYLLISVLVTMVMGSCDIPPQFWCDSKEIAEECEVLSQCAKWKWTDTDARAVFVSVYMESLCPDTIHFITTVLYPTWIDLFPTGIMKTAFLPYGNANETKLANGTFKYTCQHGPEECVGNAIENCLIDLSHYNESIYLPIIYCMENAKDPVEAAKMCIEKGGLSWSAVDDCLTSKKGNLLVHESAVNTMKLKPPHSFIPWIVINGIGSEKVEQQALKNLGWLVCESYRGTKPKPCDKYMKNV